MLAGRKLLLADDSATIQKVIDLTFADEGVHVVAVDNGQQAIDQIEEIAPDIVLADVFMPGRTGYEVCEYVKTNEHLKHIPVLLLVGSFEPFDEAEARRVGADDILTKPFQSIRRLIDRVGALVSKPPGGDQDSPTAELPKVEEPEEDAAFMDTHELEVTTADTLPLKDAVVPQEFLPREENMETGVTEDSADVLLDLGEMNAVRASAEEEEFVLDLEEDAGDIPSYKPTPARAFVEPQVKEAVATAGAYESTYQPEAYSSFADTQEVPYASEVNDVAAVEREPEPVYAAPTNAPTTSDQLSPEMIDAIARRCVELMSDKVIREIAWEVVPDLAELLIKRQLEEKESQAR